MGKPSKNRTVTLDTPAAKNLPGKAVLYIGLAGESMSCPSCGKKVTKAIVWDYEGKNYCSRGCISNKQD